MTQEDYGKANTNSDVKTISPSGLDYIGEGPIKNQFEGFS